MTSATSFAANSFEWLVEDVKLPKSDINSLILDYLTTEGYPNAAERFCKEANLQPQQDLDSIRIRQKIQSLIHRGHIQPAIETLNELDPQILDNDKALHFSLLRLQLVELIRSCNASGGDVLPALKFAREQLGPRAPTNPKFVEVLEETMVLILFPLENLNPHSAALLKPELRRVAADDVNRAILGSQSARREAAIRHLVRMRVWAENTARERGRSLPRNIDIGLKDEGPYSQGRTQFGGDSDGEHMMT